MNNEFQKKVRQLFCSIVTSNDESGTIPTEGGAHVGEKKGSIDAHDLLDILQQKETQPIATYWNKNLAKNTNVLRLVYDNVSLDVAEDLSSLDITYTGEHTIEFCNLQYCDAFQLSEFVLELEIDVPKWQYIWTSEEKLKKERAKIDMRIKLIKSRIHSKWVYSTTDITHEQEQELRLLFYNVKAIELMLAQGNPLWKNKKTEREILDEFHSFRISPPIEQWQEDWMAFAAECEKEKCEVERRQKEYQTELVRMHHLINIKHLKIEAFLNTIERHPMLTLKARKHFNMQKPSKEGWYSIAIAIGEPEVSFKIYYKDVDSQLGKIVDCLKRINDKMPLLESALLADGDKYFVAIQGYYREMGQNYMFFLSFPFYIGTYLNDNMHIKVCKHLQSSKVIDEINAIYREIDECIHNTA